MSNTIINSNVPGKREVTLKRGIYRFECWGASGGSHKLLSSSGAYVSGTISIPLERKFYIFIGEKGSPRNKTTTFNGGGAALLGDTSSADNKASHASSGGGATDIRYVNGNWYDLESLKSRIMVASGGGGETNHARIMNGVTYDKPEKGANGGTLVGENSSYSQCYQCTQNSYTSAGGGEQEKGGNKGGGNVGWGNPGSFGRGADAGPATDNWQSSGGGSGYFGGGSGGVSSNCLGTGAGGSSFVSGCKGCSAITESFTLESPKFLGNVHYSGLVFSNIIMKNGSIVARNGMNGQVIITLQNSYFCSISKYRHPTFVFFYVLVISY